MGTFVPTGTLNMIGMEAYKKCLHGHNQFLHLVTTIPIGDFQHATLDLPFSMDTNTDIDTTILTEIILEQPWCLSLECSTTPNKVMVITMISQLSAA